MAVRIRSEKEIELMRESGRRLAEVLSAVHAYLKPGLSTLEVDHFAEQKILSLGGKPNFRGAEGFPGSICISINEEIVHGVPSSDHFLHEGDVVSIDTGMDYQGWQSDAARTWGIGEISPEARKLIDVTRESFFEGMKFMRPGHHLYEVSKAIGENADRHGYGVVKELSGHGIGRHLHEYPDIPNFAQKRRGPLLMENMTFAVEPMITEGSPNVVWAEDGMWAVTTADGSLAAHYENTIRITSGEPELLTITREEIEDVESRCN
ncbi:MAG: type I methionyl aminopeptidase [Lachnospiraceae bacterium]|nr:type I methionyl aminopeptidase [Lachnospiraceae bacterium]